MSETKSGSRRAQVLGAVLFLIGFVVAPVGCFSESRVPSVVALVGVVVGGLLYIIGKLTAA